MAYADETYYREVYKGTSEVNAVDLELSSMHIDSLTYNRIVGQGFSGLTPFQQDVVRKVCCLQADFEKENAELISSVLKSYSLNGASMSFGDSWNVSVENGIAMRRDTYALLMQTGLCTRRLL